MPVTVTVLAVGDTPPVQNPKGGYEGLCTGFIILEKGTGKGKTSCAVMTEDENGKSVMVQFTGDMFLTMAAALKGARQRFGDPWNGV